MWAATVISFVKQLVAQVDPNMAERSFFVLPGVSQIPMSSMWDLDGNHVSALQHLLSS